MTWIVFILDEFSLGCIGTDVVSVCNGLDLHALTFLIQLQASWFWRLSFSCLINKEINLVEK